MLVVHNCTRRKEADHHVIIIIIIIALSKKEKMEKKIEPGIVALPFSPSTREAQAGRSLGA